MPSGSHDGRDPRSDAEKARADLKRNTEMDMAIPMSPGETRPSVTPETFGEHADPRYEGPVEREERDDPLPEAP